MAANTLFTIHGITGQVFRGTLQHGQSGVPILDERGAPAGFVSRTDILCAVTTDPPLSLWA
jgi:CBS domain-containing protein